MGGGCDRSGEWSVYLSVVATGLLGYDADTRFRRDCYVLKLGKFLGLNDRHGNSTSCKQITTLARDKLAFHMYSGTGEI